MPNAFFATLGQIVRFIIGLAVAVILGTFTWFFAGLYQDEVLQKQFEKEGTLVSVRVDEADHKQRSWRDIMSNSVYLSVTYQGKSYTTRYVRDTTYISAGDHVNLLYDATYDGFRQPNGGIHNKESTLKSRLINWSTVGTFSTANQLLFMCILLATATFFLVTGLIVTLVPLTFLQDIAGLIFTIELFLGAIFFSYDTWKYFEYYQDLKTRGQQVDVRVLDTDRIGNRGNTRTGAWKTYEYQAKIRYQQQERIIPISEDDYDQVKPTESLKAYYDQSVNDFMSVDYSPEYSRIIIPLFFGFLAFTSLRSGFNRRKRKPRPKLG